MNRESAIAWSYWRSSRGFVLTSLMMSVVVWMIAYTWPSTKDSITLYLAGLLGWLWALHAPTTITDHHLSLPVSTAWLATVNNVYAFVLSGALCLLTMVGLNLLGATWRLPEFVFLSGVLGAWTVGVASVVQLKGQEEAQMSLIAFFVLFVSALFLMDASGTASSSVVAQIDSSPMLRWAVLVSAAVLAWLPTFFGLRFRRRNDESLLYRALKWLAAIDIPLSRILLPKWSTAKSPLEAIIALDMRRCHEGLALLGIGAGVFVALLYVLTDDRTVFMVFPCVGIIVPCGIYFITRSFWSYDQSKNGAFRWTLPVDDRTLAYGMLSFLFRVLVVIWFTWLVGLCVLLAVNFLQGRDLIDEFKGLRRLGAAAYWGQLIALPVGFLVVSWVAASMGMLHSYIGRVRDMLLVFAIYLSPFIVTPFIQNYIPQSYRFVFVQSVLGLVGLIMIVRTIRVFAYAKVSHMFTGSQLRNLFLGWLLASMVTAIPVLWLGFGAGAAMLCGGVWALALYPWAGLPFAIYMVRHWPVPAPEQQG